MAELKLPPCSSNGQDVGKPSQHVNEKPNQDVDEPSQDEKPRQPLPGKGRPKSQMVLLAEKMLAEAQRLDTYMSDHNLPAPGFDADAPTDVYRIPGEARESRQQMALAARELWSLAMGPSESIRWMAWSFLDCMSLQILNKYSIAKLVPLDSSISLQELAGKTTLDAVNLARALRHAMTSHVFHEPSPGFVAHTAASRVLAEDESLRDWIGYNCDEVFPASGHVVEALLASPEAESPLRAGFNYASGTVDREPLFATLGRDPARARQFSGAMASLTGGEGYEVSHLVRHWDLSDVDARGGTLVDVGGSHGFASIHLARRWPGISFVVQDLPGMIATAPKPLCEEESVAARIELQAHDFFEEQPVRGADVYFFRWILHNHSAAYAVDILKKLVPALKPGARVVINEHCVREPGGESAWDERLVRSMDLIMLALLNAQVRDEEAFREVFAAADSRYDVQPVRRLENCRMAVVEAIWRP